MQLIDEPGALADDGLEAAGDLAQGAQWGGQDWSGGGSLAESIACGGAGLDGIGLVGAVEGGAIVLIALRIARGDGEGGIGERVVGCLGCLEF